LTISVSRGSPPSTRIFVFGRVTRPWREFPTLLECRDDKIASSAFYDGAFADLEFTLVYLPAEAAAAAIFSSSAPFFTACTSVHSLHFNCEPHAVADRHSAHFQRLVPTQPPFAAIYVCSRSEAGALLAPGILPDCFE
jgi:hypothetical protein